MVRQPSAFQTNVLPENPLLAQHLPKQLLPGQREAAGGEELSNALCAEREGCDCCSHMWGPQTITHTHGCGSKPYSIKISPAVLHFLESSLNLSEG